jgi:hypothetical protein
MNREELKMRNGGKRIEQFFERGNHRSGGYAVSGGGGFGVPVLSGAGPENL